MTDDVLVGLFYRTQHKVGYVFLYFMLPARGVQESETLIAKCFLILIAVSVVFMHLAGTIFVWSCVLPTESIHYPHWECPNAGASKCFVLVVFNKKGNIAAAP